MAFNEEGVGATVVAKVVENGVALDTVPIVDG